jgi:hypothetical protein
VRSAKAACAQDRLAQPLQAEDQQQRANDEAQRVDRQCAQGWTERGHHGGEREEPGGAAG